MGQYIVPTQDIYCVWIVVHLIPKWPSFYCSFVSLQIGAFDLASKRKIQKNRTRLKEPIKPKNTKVAAILEW